MFRQFIQDIISLAKSWSFQRQMLFCYISGMFIYLLLIFFLVYFNYYQLSQLTIKRIQQTLNDQAKDNMKALAEQGQSFLVAQIATIRLLLTFLKDFFKNMFIQETFSLDYVQSYDWDLTLKNCNLQTSSDYGQVCFQYSTYYPLIPDINTELLQKSSRFNIFWQQIYNLTNSQVFRFVIFFDYDFYIIYPGQKMVQYEPTQQIWYQKFIQNNKTETITRPYPDQLGNPENNIITLAIPLQNLQGDYIGSISADFLIKNLYSNFGSLRYLGDGYSSLLYQDGQIIQQFNQFWSTQYTHIQNCSDKTLWKSVQELGNNFFIQNDQIYRMVSTPITDYSGKTAYYLLFMVEQTKIMEYKVQYQDTMQNTGYFLFLANSISAFIAIIVIIIVIIHFAKSVTDPLEGIIAFTDRINKSATQKHAVTIADLNQLKQGEYQVAQLVQAYQSLARTLISTSGYQRQSLSAIGQSEKHPPNELYRTELPWVKYLDDLPDN